MTKEKLNEIAKQIAEEEKRVDNKNTKRIINKIRFLIRDCSIEDLDQIDELIREKYLTN